MHRFLNSLIGRADAVHEVTQEKPGWVLCAASGLLLLRAWLAGFCPKECELVRIVLNLLVDADSSRVASANAIVQQHGTTAGRGCLQQCRHFARMQRRHARVAVTGEEKHGRICHCRA